MNVSLYEGNDASNPFLCTSYLKRICFKQAFLCLLFQITDVFPAKMDLVLGVSTFVMCSAALILPLCPSLELMGVSFALQGLGQAALSASK